MLNIKELRNSIADQVITAITNAPIEQTENGSTISEERKQELGEMNTLGTNLGEFEDTPNKIFVENPHLYPILLEIAFEQALLDVGYSEEDLRNDKSLLEWTHQSVDYSFLHEMEHAVPGMGYESLDIRYGVRFWRDQDHDLFIDPLIQRAGTASQEILNDMLTAVNEPSEGDHARNN